MTKLAQARWQRGVAAAVSLLLLGAVLWRLHSAGWERLLALVPSTPAFWAALLAFYFALPIGEWLIYRRLWRLPARGLAPLLRKRISNDILFGYSGELYFYLWARSQPQMTEAPFGAVKDVNVTSALVAAAVTLAMVAAAAPWLGALSLGRLAQPLLLSAVALAVVSLALVAFGRRVFSLDRSALLAISGIHLARLLATTLLLALVWHLALPAVALTTWLLLATARMLVGRLPFVPNTDLVFATLTGVLVGPRNPIGDLLAATTLLSLGIHVAVLAGLGVLAVAGRRR